MLSRMLAAGINGMRGTAKPLGWYACVRWQGRAGRSAACGRGNDNAGRFTRRPNGSFLVQTAGLFWCISAQQHTLVAYANRCHWSVSGTPEG